MAIAADAIVGGDEADGGADALLGEPGGDLGGQNVFAHAGPGHYQAYFHRSTVSLIKMNTYGRINSTTVSLSTPS